MPKAAWQLEIHLRKLREELEQAKADDLPTKRIATLERMSRRMAQRVDKAVAKELADRERLRQKMNEKALKRRQKAQERVKAERAKPRSTPTRTKALPARNHKRADRMSELRFSHSDGYRAYMGAQPCIRCGRPATKDYPSQCMHMRGVDLGGTAEDMLPGCAACHNWQETHKRQFDEEFVERHGLTPLEMAHAMRAAFLLRLEDGEQT